MKHLFVPLTFLFLLPAWLEGQNFDPFPGTQHLFGYRNTLNDSAQHIVTIDSVYSSGGEVVKVFRRGIHGAGFRWGCGCLGDGQIEKMYLDRDDSFGQEVRLGSNGIVSFITDTQDTFELDLMAPIGVPQAFGISDTATLVSRALESVGGVQDSVLTYDIAGPGDYGTWKLSQNYGLLQARELVVRDSTGVIDRSVFNLAGSPSLGWGASIPNWLDFMALPDNHLYFYESSMRDYDGLDYNYRSWTQREERIQSTTVWGQDSIEFQLDQEYANRWCQTFIGCDTTYYAPTPVSRKLYHDNYRFLDGMSFSVVFRGALYYSPWWMVDDYSVATNGDRILKVTPSFAYNYDSSLNALIYGSTAFYVRGEVYQEGLGKTCGCILEDDWYGTFENNFRLVCEMPYSPTASCFDFSPFYSNLVGAPEPELAPKLVIWPNPARETLHLKSDQPATVQLVDLRGMSITPPQKIHTTLELDLTEIPAGLYILRWESPQGQQYIPKVIVKQ